MFELLAALLLVQDVGVQRVVAAISQVAASNSAKPEAERIAGDELADRYVRGACATGQPARAIVLGIAYALEPTGLIAKNPLAAGMFKDVETPESRKSRLSAMGKPTMRGREDWLAHFAVSAGMTVLVGDEMAETIGVQKEVTDAVAKGQGTGSGFSFTDLNADVAGVVFGGWLVSEKSGSALKRCATSFRGADFLPDPAGLQDGLTLTEFEAAWGGARDPKLLAERQRLRTRVKACKGYEER